MCTTWPAHDHFWYLQHTIIVSITSYQCVIINVFVLIFLRDVKPDNILLDEQGERTHDVMKRSLTVFSPGIKDGIRIQPIFRRSSLELGRVWVKDRLETLWMSSAGKVYWPSTPETINHTIQRDSTEHSSLTLFPLWEVYKGVHGVSTNVTCNSYARYLASRQGLQSS